jgi:CHASE3 domain sensor protein
MPDDSLVCFLGRIEQGQRALQEEMRQLRAETRDDSALLRADLFEALAAGKKEILDQAQPAIDSDKFYRRLGASVMGGVSFLAACVGIFKFGESAGWWK